MKGLLRCLTLAVMLLVLPATLTAQEGPVTFEFSFSNPGARSMGLGGAFAALADDATAAFANPAGLVQLLEPEVSVEGRWRSYRTPYVAGGRISGVPTGVGVDTVSSIRHGFSTYESNDLSFLSFVYPARRWSIAAYRHQWADFDLASGVNGLFAVIEGEDERSEDVVASTRFKVVNNGLACAYKLSDSLSIGLGLAYYTAELDSLSREYAYNEDVLYIANPYLPEQLDTTYFLVGSGSGISVQGGLLWRVSPRWSIGSFYREGPRMAIVSTEITGPADEDDPPGTIERKATDLHLPDMYGLGVAFRTRSNTVTLSFEWARVRYSSISDSLDGSVFDAGQLAMSDGDELHLGLEYIIMSAQPVIGLRLGAWRDPAHGLGASADADPFERTIYSGGDDRIHLGGGVSLVLDRFQLDLGVDLSETVDQASLSIVYRF